jgi:hypothetical protein
VIVAVAVSYVVTLRLAPPTAADPPPSPSPERTAA